MINNKFIKIITNRFILRPLNLNDVTTRYSNWLLQEASNRFIQSKLSKDKLKSYVAEKSNRDDILFLGIFYKDNNLHIGNIKYEPIDPINKIAIMGILIGDKNWRGQGVAKEIILASANWLHFNLGISYILLTVNKENIAAMRAYKKIGFVKKKTQYLKNLNKDLIPMVLNIAELAL